MKGFLHLIDEDVFLDPEEILFARALDDDEREKFKAETVIYYRHGNERLYLTTPFIAVLEAIKRAAQVGVE